MYKVMIVDDETIVRKGLMCFIDWTALDCEVVCEASDGIEAIEQLAVHDIDFIVTDIRMAGMDGIELSKFVHENFPYIKVIILTAFADFTYAQSAIKYQAVDFIVKTNPSETVPGAINKAKQLLLKEKDHEQKLIQLENVINDNRNEIREKFLKDVVCGIIANEADLVDKATELAIKLDSYLVVHIEIRDASEQSEIDKSASDNLHRFTDSIKQFLTLAFDTDPHYMVVLNKHSLLAMVSFPTHNTAESTRILQSTCNEILSMAENFMRFSVNIGISGMHRDISTLSLAYVESCQAIQGSFYNENHVSTYIPLSGQVPDLESRPYNVAQQITECLQEGQYDTAIERLNELMEKYRSIKEPIENIKVACLIIGSYCFRLLEARQQPIDSDLTGDESSLYKQVLESKSIQNLLHILEKLIADISQALSMIDRQQNYIVIETQKYIRENFNKNLTLQIIADHIHVNSSYLSRLYKREAGESLVDTINKYRIEIAKRLLKDPSKKVFEVSSAVGIDSPAYFTHVFTKYTGLSPKTYKLNFFQNGRV